MNEKPVLEKSTSDDVEMSDFLRLLGKIFTKIGNAIAWLFMSLYDLLIIFFLFIKRKIIWLLLGLVLGFAYGIYSNSGPVYSSEMVAKVNLENNYFLYNQIEYFNSLIKNGRLDQLANHFNISETEAKNLIEFKVAPVKSDIESAKLFRQTFLQTRRNHNYSFDTVWLKTLKFNEFKAQLTDYDYPLNTITVRSRQQDIFPKIQQGILSSINNDPGLKQKIENVKEIRKQDENLLTSVLTNIDTLRQVYNKKIARESENPSNGGNQFLLSERNARNPELDLYDKSLMIKDELIELKEKAADENEVLKLYSGFGNIGSRESGLSGIINKTLSVLLVTFIVLLFIEFVKFLNRTEKKRMK